MRPSGRGTTVAAITRESLWSLERYAKERSQFRARVMAHKKNRTVRLGAHLTLIFEDELTVRYQIQEMLRAERLFEDDAIHAELAAYNPLVPDGTNWKATMIIEYPGAAERAAMLEKLIGIEDRLWVQAQGCSRVYAIADEDIDRENDVKTSSVHFLRFELAAPVRDAVLRGGQLSIGVDHPGYSAAQAVEPASADSLRQDLA
ncbi:MAG: DUF3501 family protein [Burkholderiales bacterium]